MAAVAYPAFFSWPATVVSLSGRPTLTVGPKTPGTPILLNCLPVINAALEPEQTGQPEYQVERTLPP